jgi:hypothetical protein
MESLYKYIRSPSFNGCSSGDGEGNSVSRHSAFGENVSKAPILGGGTTLKNERVVCKHFRGGDKGNADVKRGDGGLNSSILLKFNMWTRQMRTFERGNDANFFRNDTFLALKSHASMGVRFQDQTYIDDSVLDIPLRKSRHNLF